VEHQRLNGAGYCFSASAPPFTACAAQTCLELLQSTPSLLHTLASRARLFQSQFTSSSSLQVVSSYKESPVIHLRLTKPSETHLEEIKKLRNIAKVRFLLLFTAL
jgi:serine palmitoyltransferase